MPAWIDWVIMAVGGAFVLFGFILIVRALLRDRPRGRRRCPKCWYDMTHSPTRRCSECGREHRHERRLRKTHRHWGRAVIGCVVALIGGAAMYFPTARANGIGAVPTTVLLVQRINDWGDQLAIDKELESRADNGQFSGLHWRMIRQFSDLDGRDVVEVRITTRPKWPADRPLEVDCEFIRSTSGWGWFDAHSLTVSFRGMDGTEHSITAPSSSRRRLGTISDIERMGGVIALDVDVIRNSIGSRMQAGRREFAPDSTVQEFVIEIPVVAVAGIRDAIQLHDDPELTRHIRDGLQCIVRENSINLRRTAEIEGPGIHRLFTASIIRNGVIIRQEIYSLSAFYGDAGESSHILQFDEIPEWSDAIAQESWMVRIRSEREAALYDLEHDAFWDGEIILPLCLAEDEQGLKLESPPPMRKREVAEE